jgi:hypothetical protein
MSFTNNIPTENGESGNLSLPVFYYNTRFLLVSILHFFLRYDKLCVSISYMHYLNKN